MENKELEKFKPNLPKTKEANKIDLKIDIDQETQREVKKMGITIEINQIVPQYPSISFKCQFVLMQYQVMQMQV